VLYVVVTDTITAVAFMLRVIEANPALAAIEEKSTLINRSTNCRVNKTENTTIPPTKMSRKPSLQTPRRKPLKKPKAIRPKIPYSA
jgi:hypothetical protein